jgi:hypothetical protein
MGLRPALAQQCFTKNRTQFHAQRAAEKKNKPFIRMVEVADEATPKTFLDIWIMAVDNTDPRKWILSETMGEKVID